MIEAGIVALLLADARFTSICGQNLYPVVLPDDPSLPAVTYQASATKPDYVLSGESGLEDVTLHFHLWSKDFSGVVQMGDALRSLLGSFGGVLPDGTVVRACKRGTSVDSYEQSSRFYQRAMDFRLQCILDITSTYLGTSAGGLGSSDANTFSLFAGANAISQHQAVAVQQSNVAEAADCTDPSRVAVGIAVASSAPGAQVSVQYSGKMTNTSWNWTLGQPIYVGSDGLLTQQPPNGPAGYQQIVGYPIAEDALLVEIEEPIPFG